MPTYNKKVWIGIGCVVAFVLVVCAIIFFVSAGLTSPIKKQLVAIKSADFVTAYSYTSQDFRSATSLREFEEFVNHYPELKNNKRITFTEKEVKGGSGLVKAILYSHEETSMPIEYLLVKEDNEWRIMGIQINPANGEIHQLETTENPSTKTEPAATEGSSGLTNTYDNPESRYTIKYPANWEYEKAGDGTVIFSGKRGTPAFFSTVNIQTVLTKKTGGDFSSVKEFMTDIKHQAVSQSPNVKFVESGPITIKEKNGVEDKGEYTVFTYTYKGKEFKQWQVVGLRNDGQVFYAWAYTSPVQRYADDLEVAKAMLGSWVIY